MTPPQLEEELLKGQKLQGVLTSDEVQAVLDHNMMSHEYPLFTTVNLIVHGHVPVQEILHYKQVGHDEGLKRVQVSGEAGTGLSRGCGPVAGRARCSDPPLAGCFRRRPSRSGWTATRIPAKPRSTDPIDLRAMGHRMRTPDPCASIPFAFFVVERLSETLPERSKINTRAYRFLLEETG